MYQVIGVNSLIVKRKTRFRVNLFIVFMELISGKAKWRNKWETLCVAGGNIGWGSCFGKQSGIA